MCPKSEAPTSELLTGAAFSPDEENDTKVSTSVLQILRRKCKFGATLERFIVVMNAVYLLPALICNVSN
jgi:hypothetical protein